MQECPRCRGRMQDCGELLGPFDDRTLYRKTWACHRCRLLTTNTVSERPPPFSGAADLVAGYLVVFERSNDPNHEVERLRERERLCIEACRSGLASAGELANDPGFLAFVIGQLSFLHDQQKKRAERAEAEADLLRQRLNAAYDRVAAQSEILSRRAEKPSATNEPAPETDEYSWDDPEPTEIVRLGGDGGPHVD